MEVEKHQSNVGEGEEEEEEGWKHVAATGDNATDHAPPSANYEDPEEEMNNFSRHWHSTTEMLLVLTIIIVVSGGGGKTNAAKQQFHLKFALWCGHNDIVEPTQEGNGDIS